jgi:hypothetical protein
MINWCLILYLYDYVSKKESELARKRYIVNYSNQTEDILIVCISCRKKLNMHASFYILTCINNIDNVTVTTCPFIYVYVCLTLVDVRLLCTNELRVRKEVG